MQVEQDFYRSIGLTGSINENRYKFFQRYATKRQVPRVGIIGTSITEMKQYTSAASAVNNLGNGTWDITIASPRNFVGEGEYVQLSQGPAGINTRRALVNSISGSVINVTRIHHSHYH